MTGHAFPLWSAGIAAALVFGVWAPSASAAQLSFSSSDFTQQSYAQDVLNANPQTASALDPDGNGVACDALFSLTATPATTSGPSEQQQIDALSTQVAALTTRVARLEGERASASTRPTLPPLSSSSQPTPTAARELPSPMAIGEEASDGLWEITVKGTEERDQFQSDKQVLPHGIFIIVQMDVANAGADPQPFPWRDMRIVDATGRIFGPSPDAFLAYQIWELGMRPSDDLQPGLTYSYPVVFDIAPDASGLTLTSSDSAFAVKLDR